MRRDPRPDAAAGPAEPAGRLARWRAALARIPARYGRPQTGTPYLAQIDGLRALALLLVVVWHEALRGVRQVEALNALGYGLPSPYDYVPHGEVGVDLFFVISGFVIAQPFLSRPPAQWRIGEFYRRRLHRLYPPYLAVLVVGFLAAMTGLVHDRDVHGIPQWQSFAASLIYLHGWVFDQQSRFDPPLWSLEIEVQFYAIVPFVMRLYGCVKGPVARAAAGLGLAGVLMLLAATLHGVLPYDGRFRFGLLAHMHLFVLGIVAADLVRLRRPLERPGTRGFDCAFGCGCAGLLAIGLWQTAVDAKPPGFLPYLLTDAATAAAVALIVAGAVAGTVGRALTGAPWLCLIGTMCYSVYLVHVPVIEAVSQVLARTLPLHGSLALWVVWPVVLTVAVTVVSAAFYVAVERPFMTRQFPPFAARLLRAKRA